MPSSACCELAIEDWQACFLTVVSFCLFGTTPVNAWWATTTHTRGESLLPERAAAFCLICWAHQADSWQPCGPLKINICARGGSFSLLPSPSFLLILQRGVSCSSNLVCSNSLANRQGAYQGALPKHRRRRQKHSPSLGCEHRKSSRNTIYQPALSSFPIFVTTVPEYYLLILRLPCPLPFSSDPEWNIFVERDMVIATQELSIARYSVSGLKPGQSGYSVLRWRPNGTTTPTWSCL